MSNTVIDLKNVRHSYNLGTPIAREVLSSVNIQISRGESVGIIGVPGSGKTTLAMLMAGLEKPTSGSLKTPGLGVGKVGLVFQFPEHQIFGKTVFDDITYPLREVLDLPSEEIETIYNDACKKVDLNADLVREIKPLEMSGGERRRVAIAGILVMNPEVLIFDEPTAGLDQDGQDIILDEIGRLSTEGKTIIIISHDMGNLLYNTKRFILIEEGMVADDGPVREVLQKLSEREDKLSMLPFITELMVKLNEKGLNVRRDIFDPEEAFSEIMKALKV
ncbi:MAG: ATP-binding cassette domain-containing protein [Proteobacteria bacterium]|nr:ATP-binding cassette domain-containing protein [Pseudomonadota bacterium]